jgi:hypothetical protein
MCITSGSRAAQRAFLFTALFKTPWKVPKSVEQFSGHVARTPMGRTLM